MYQSCYWKDNEGYRQGEEMPEPNGNVIQRNITTGHVGRRIRRRLQLKERKEIFRAIRKAGVSRKIAKHYSVNL